ncbi:cell division protein ftsh [hydrocarbon metagenome]|uniref:Cell division protein ftsh n=1 Tax=hydrocarbon metagenome TaxID=938273 RepID=A0A0W8FKG3_9ZZZZ
MSEILQLMEILLSAEIFNQHQDLDINDMTPGCREFFGAGSDGSPEVKRPLIVSEGMIRRTLGIPDAYRKLSDNPFVGYEEFGQRLRITALEPAAAWFLKKGGEPFVIKNPALAYYFERTGMVKADYRSIREQNVRFEDTKAYLDAKVAQVVGDSEEMRNARDLMIISAPEELRHMARTLVCTPRQEEIVRKIRIVLANREFLNRGGISEFGRLLFVGPPGTGKTSLALAMSGSLHMPVLEVRLAMVTSQYLGETSKNVDRIFDLAKKLAPCILFIDEFDYVAKSRVSDDHGAMKRAVNMLLKNIDQISLIRHGVLLIGATNHPGLLDEAAWRRFDEVVEFPLPDEFMRREILQRIASPFECTCDFSELAARTDGLSGADLRMMMKEAILSALMRNGSRIDQEDIERGLLTVEERNLIRRAGTA